MTVQVDVSIVTPVYKGNRFLPSLLQMVENNAKHFNNRLIELVLVNDSPEIELEIDDSLVKHYRLSVVENSTNMGIQSARIAGIRHAKGNYIMLLDQDDSIEDNAIQSQFEKIGHYDAILSNGFYEDSSYNRISLFSSKRQQKHANYLNYYYYFGNVIASPGLCLMKKSSIPEVWMNHILRVNGADDWLLWVSFLMEGKTFTFNDDYLYVHINRGDNVSNDTSKMLQSSKEALEILNKVIPIPTKLYKVYIRRLEMQKNYQHHEFSIRKLKQYLKNIDIMLYLANHKYFR